MFGFAKLTRPDGQEFHVAPTSVHSVSADAETKTEVREGYKYPKGTTGLTVIRYAGGLQKVTESIGDVMAALDKAAFGRS